MMAFVQDLFLEGQELEVRLVFRLDREVNVVLHAPIEDLVMDRQVEGLCLRRIPDLADRGVADFRIRFRGQALDLGINAGVRNNPSRSTSRTCRWSCGPGS